MIFNRIEKNLMQKRKIGSSEIFVSAMGLGTVKFGRNTQVKYPYKFELPSDQDLKKLLKETYSLGINFLDNSPSLWHKRRENW